MRRARMKYQTLQELERHTLTLVEKILCRIIIDRIRSGVDDRLRKDTLERTGRI